MDTPGMIMQWFSLLLFPAGLTLVLLGMSYEWFDRKLLALLQNRVGPRWFQPVADTVKLLAKEEVIPEKIDKWLFIGLPIVAMAGSLTAALYIPLLGFPAHHSFQGDLIFCVYLLSLLSITLGLAGSNTLDRFSLIGATRTLTQLFAYEAPLLMALIGPAFAAGSWQISEICAYTSEHWLILYQPLGFVVAIIALMGKLELPPFDAPEAETEIVAGTLTEYSGRGLALFRLAKSVALMVGLTLIAAFYLGGITTPLGFLVKTLALLGLMVTLQSVLTRLRIDQTVGLWWRYGVLLVLVQWFVTLALQRMGV